MRIEELLARRTDLSTFLVHLTRSFGGVSAKKRLKKILADDLIKATSPFGHAVSLLKSGDHDTDSQKCVCFTETPLEHVGSLLGDIEDRTCEFEPYGIAITKRQGRKRGVNPVWYIDITPGHDWLTNPLNELVQAAIDDDDTEFADSPIAKLTPFIEQMGRGAGAMGGGYRKEFWWEREWRHVGDFSLPGRAIVLCPEDEREEFRAILNADECTLKAKLIDPRWGLEQIIARLAGFDDSDVGPM